ncbi:MAG: hypothetical protein KGK01_06040 [Bradyrhizobium sp.]|nr:hypothetical protein [Bradyrhizobium sp.]
MPQLNATPPWRAPSPLILVSQSVALRRGSISWWLPHLVKGALPMHDSVIVARSDAELARRMMQEESLRMTGAEIPVKIERG